MMYQQPVSVPDTVYVPRDAASSVHTLARVRGEQTGDLGLRSGGHRRDDRRDEERCERD